MDHLQQVLEFIENNTNKSNKKTSKEPPEIDHSNGVLHHVVGHKKRGDGCGKAIENCCQLTDIFLSKVSDNGRAADVSDLKCDRSGGEAVNISQPEVVWV